MSNVSSPASYIAIALDNANAYNLIEIHNKNVKSSINYAKTIQNTILPSKNKLNRLCDNFIISRPKDIVSGDFYWSNRDDSSNNAIYFLAVADGTGHGVPGAFMSMIGSNLLNDIIIEKKIIEPVEISDMMDSMLNESLRKDESNNQDGMDACMVSIGKQEYLSANDQFTLKFAGAGSPLYRYNCKTGETGKIKGSVKPVENKYTKRFSFEQKTITINKGDILYLSSDGYIDQQSPQRKRLTSTVLMKALSKNATLSMEKQILEETLDNHKKAADQRDDITLIGIKL